MNDLHFNTNLNFEPFIVPAEDLPTSWWNLIPKDMINKNLLDFLFERGIQINIISSFYEECSESYIPNCVIHSDCHGIGDVTKLIWLWGDHEMSWFAYKTNIPMEFNILENDASPENTIRKFTVFDQDKVEKIYSSKIGFPSLIQVGIPHQIITLSGARRSLSMVLQDMNNNFITMNDAKLILKDYLLD
jgi:hypothetical protein